LGGSRQFLRWAPRGEQEDHGNRTAGETSSHRRAHRRDIRPPCLCPASALLLRKPGQEHRVFPRQVRRGGGVSVQWPLGHRVRSESRARLLRKEERGKAASSIEGRTDSGRRLLDAHGLPFDFPRLTALLPQSVQFAFFWVSNDIGALAFDGRHSRSRRHGLPFGDVPYRIPRRVVGSRRTRLVCLRLADLGHRHPS
jgi:hypothetical protein